MTDTLVADRRVVTDRHCGLLRLLAETVAEYGEGLGLHLNGGTALAAYYLHHRQSEDLDVFGDARTLVADDFARAFLGRATAAGWQATTGPYGRAIAEMYLRHAEALTAPAIKVQILRASPFRLEPICPTAELLPVADYRDVCAGKMHAICDRVEPRDFVDFWAMLHRGTPTVSDDVLERRLRRLMDDLVAHDPGLGPEQLGRALERGLDRDLLEGFALRLLQPVSSDDVQQAILRSLTVISRIVRQGWSGPTVSGPGPSQAQQGARSDDLPPESRGRRDHTSRG